MGIYENLPYTNYHDLNADWIVKEIQRVAAEWVAYRDDLDTWKSGVDDDVDTWKSGVDDQLATFQAWFDSLDLSAETRTIIQEMVASGQFITVTQPTITSTVETWLTDHISGTVAVDNTLTISGAAADSKKVGDKIADLKGDFSVIENFFDNPNYASKIVDKTGLMVGSGQVLTGSSDTHTILFPVEPETEYIITMPMANRSGFTGNSTNNFVVGQTYTAFSASVTGADYYVFTTPASVNWVMLYFYVGAYTFDRSDFGLYKGDSVPTDLAVRLKASALPLEIPYTKLENIPYSKITDVLVLKGETEFIKRIEGTNRFNKDDEDVTPKRMIDADGNIITLSASAYIISGYVPIEENTQYCIYCGSSDAGQYSTNAYYTAIMYDSTKTKKGKVTGSAETGYYTLTTSAGASYMRVNIYNSLDVFMIIKGSTYPAIYIPFSDKYVLEGVETSGSESVSMNPLYGKTILWNGDSICAGKAFNDTDDAWAGRIAKTNSMIYKNYAQGGGTITENVQDGGITKHSVCATLATMYSENPDADYIVFDGGCNDADLLGSMIGGSTPARLGTFTLSDFSGSYDEDTFCGAFESILYRMTDYWRDAKIAYIIPHKMGILNEYRTDYTKEHHNYRAYYDLAIQMCIKWGVPYLDLWDKCFFCPMISHLCDTNSTMTQQDIYDAGMVYADRQHLTQHGYDLEAPMIENWLKTL